MSTVVDLPNELLIEVCGHRRHVAERPTTAFRSLCLTSRWFRALAEPFLYYTNIHTLDDLSQHVFPCTLVDRPDLDVCDMLAILLVSTTVEDLHLRYGGGID